jgi:hypothetical protein
MNTLDLIMTEDELGKNFRSLHSENAILEMKEKHELARIMIRFIISKNYSTSKGDIKILAASIPKYFTREDPDEYFDGQSGMLFNKYNYELGKRKKQDPDGEKAPPTKRMKLEVMQIVDEIGQNEFSEEELQANAYVLEHPMENFGLLRPHWNASYRVRRSFIMNLGQNGSITDIVQKYTSFKRSDGYLLVSALVLSINGILINRYFLKLSMDYGQIFGSDTFIKKWRDSKPTLFKVLQKNVKNVAIKEKFKDYELASENSKSLIILNGLSAFLFSAGVKSTDLDEGQKRSKPTILDGVSGIYWKKENYQALQNGLYEKRQTLAKMGEALQPLIAEYGDEVNAENNFIVSFDAYFYKIADLDVALEQLLKLYHVYDVIYPRASASILNFLSIYFCGLKSVASSKIKSLMSLLDNEE